MLIKNALLYTGEELVKRDLLIKEGRVCGVAPCIPGEGDLDAAGRLVSPGFIDPHVHLRESGFCYKETIATGTAAAAAGGFTTICAMPNLSPAPDTREELKRTALRIERNAAVHVLPYGCITVGEKGEKLAEIGPMAPLCIGFSDDGKGVQSEEMMRRAMEEVAHTGSFICAHCEVESMLKGGYVHDGPWAAAHGHKGICSQSETAEVARDIRLAGETGCRLHICHVSARESLAEIRAGKKAGVRVTCEVTPHQALLCDEDISEDHGRFKMNPPLREKADRDAIREGLRSGLIDAIATDHAPHAAEEKARPLTEAPSGMVGLETALAVTLTELYHTGHMGLSDILRKMTINPACILRLNRGRLAVGADADVVIFDPEEEWTVDPEAFASKGRNTPFAGRKVKGKVKYTIVGGEIVYREGA